MLPGAATQPPSQHVASDTTGRVRVVVDAQGRVDDVEIDQRWRTQLAPEQLPNALMESYNAGRVRAGEAYTAAVMAAREAGVPAPQLSDGPAKGGSERLRPLGPDADREARWRRIREMLAEFEEGRARRARIIAEAGQTRELTGPCGYLTATVHRGTIVNITGDARKIQYASTDHLRQDALAILSIAK